MLWLRFEFNYSELNVSTYLSYQKITECSVSQSLLYALICMMDLEWSVGFERHITQGENASTRIF